ncbi:alpha/beta hydrolase [Subsaximicrobium wynnwilliamsii]|uniref:Alpha/beta hydrolase n=1 Tax=Subsaximicrobium wynnwilliamsii TaxID=291179 RepID=A0A5C6ZDM0_9FLAO|nr:alpha/beta hydrolase [Subsaximicrobium wynnwilliamsii]TXD82345.1 alpha/beta hydrolase [Subsaximicrobium wynnwilliamsii]TXD87983.1 alpha/beta hydrolase [Subsaximicrobium wynnwilliamsii]TXE01976.1 alpha/beta hydrolase [Subsaximicrobium wynnwilliamsii]
MKHIKITLLALFIAFGFTSCSDNDASPSPENNPDLLYQETLNVSYGNDTDQKFDLYLPANRTLDTKVMIMIHGGGWISGDKADMNFLKDLMRLDLPNIAIVNMNYRLADANNPPIPMQIDDISTVVDMLKAKQDEYVISDDIGFVGVSAGAHLSLLWSYAHDSNSQVKMVGSVVGPTNLTDPAYLESENPYLLQLIEVFGIDTSSAFLESVSPYHQATTSSPPTILFNGGNDPLVPTSQGIDMDAKLSSLGVTHSFTLYPEEGHGWTGAALLDTWISFKAFTKTHLED